MPQSFRADLNLGVLPEIDERDNLELYRELVRVRRAIRALADAINAQANTSIGSATFVANAGTAVNTASTFDGYTLPQVVKALRTLGMLA